MQSYSHESCGTGTFNDFNDACRQYSFDEGPPQPVLLDATSLKPGSLCMFLPEQICVGISTTSSLRHLGLGLWGGQGGRGTCHVAASAAEGTCKSGSAFFTCHIPGDRDEFPIVSGECSGFGCLPSFPEFKQSW